MSFDARVAGIPDFLSDLKSSLGKDDASFAQRKFDAAKQALTDKHGKAIGKKEISQALKQKAEPVSHIMFERHGFLEPLQRWGCNRNGTTLEAVRTEGAWTEYLHLSLMGSNDALGLPLDFSTPVEAPVDERAFPLMVVSVPKLLEELELANKTLKVESSLRNHKLPPFVAAGKREVERLEHVECLDESFWVKFGLVALRQLAQASMEHGLPLIVEPTATARVGQ